LAQRQIGLRCPGADDVQRPHFEPTEPHSVLPSMAMWPSQGYRQSPAATPGNSIARNADPVY
jgi:hypothetical protein